MNDVVGRIRIPLFDDQTNNLIEAVRNGYLVRGPHLDQLSEVLGRLIGKKYVLLTANGFSALFAVLKAARISSGRVVTTPASTCFAIVNAIKAAGREPRFVEMDAASASISAIENPPDEDSDCIAIVPDHFGIIAPACRGPRTRPGMLIEDAAQSFLSLIQARTEVDVVVLSLYPTKLLNGIDGGAVLTDDRDIYERVRKVASYAGQREVEASARYNLGMNNVNAAFALGTIAHLDHLRSTLLRLHERITHVLARRGIRVMAPGVDDVPSRLIVVVDGEKHRDAMMATFRQAGIQASRELMPVCPPEFVDRFPVMQRLVATTMSLPFHPAMSEKDVAYIETVIGCL